MVLTRWLEERIHAFDRFNTAMGLMIGNDLEPVGDWNPNFVVESTDSRYTISAELPDCSLADIHALLEGETLKIVGCREIRNESEEEHGVHLHAELATFRHELQLPGAGHVEPVPMTIRNGLLTVTIPRTK